MPLEIPFKPGTPLPETAHAQAAYEAYSKYTGGVTFDGRPMPTWAELPDKIRDAWRTAAAAAVRSHALAAHDARNVERTRASRGGVL